MCFEELLLPLGLECPSELFGIEVSGIATDSRRVTENSIFICIEGLKYDGHDYISDAIGAGAKVIVAKTVRDVCVGGAAILYVENTRSVASLLYNLWYGNPVSKMKFIGITGTNGKTSVAYMLYAILEAAGARTGLIGTVEYLSANGRELERGGSMTTPDSQQLYSLLSEMQADGVEYVVMEVSSHALELSRVEAIEFETAVFTNLSEEHLDFHSDMDKYYSAKEKLFYRTRNAVVNIDGEAGKKLYSFLCKREISKKTCSQSKGDFCALDVKFEKNRQRYVLVREGDKCHAYTVELRLAGDFQIMNSLEAIAAAEFCGIDTEIAIATVSRIEKILGRMESVEAFSGQDIRVLIDYAHTPDALERLLWSARAFSRRIILLFGCGGDRDKQKRKTMGQIASRLADFVVITSDNSRSEDPRQIIREILKGINKEKEFIVIESRRTAITEAIVGIARAGDTVILAGKGHEAYEIDKDGYHPFDERLIAREALCERRRLRWERKEKNEG